MTALPPLDLDVRPLCASGRPPLPAILSSVNRLEPGQALRLTAPFEPAPLYDLLAQRGFDHTAEEQGDGSWVILFQPRP